MTMNHLSGEAVSLPTITSAFAWNSNLYWDQKLGQGLGCPSGQADVPAQDVFAYQIAVEGNLRLLPGSFAWEEA